jgi:STE24 endopeptidase
MATLEAQSAERAALAQRYTRLKRRLSLLASGLSLLWLIALLTFGWSQRLRDFAFSVSPRPSIALLVYVLVLGAASEALHLPFSFYSGHIVEHRFELSRMTLGKWAKDRLKALGLSAVLGIAAVELLYWALRRYPATWWGWVAASFVFFGIVLTRLAPVLLFPLFFKFTPLENEELVRRLSALCERLGARACGVWEWKLSEKSRKSNAALVGWGSTRRIILADTLLGNHTAEEIETILAHELGHHIHGDIRKAILIEAGLVFGTLYLIHRVLVWATPRYGFEGLADFANLPLVLIVSALFSLLLLPAANAYSRWRERLADVFALRATRNPAAFASAMRKLAEQNLIEPKPHPVVEWLLYSHPPVHKRIAFAEQIKL